MYHTNQQTNQIAMKIGTITTEQMLKHERQVRRQSDIEHGVKPMGHKVHRSQKTYSRKGIKFN